MECYSIGIDIGTTTVKVTVIDDNKSLVGSVQLETDAYVPVGQSKKEQDVSKILLTIRRAIQSFPVETRKKVHRLGVSGQMHGVVLWTQKTQDKIFQGHLCEHSISELSHLITWEDSRCSRSFLDSLTAWSRASYERSGTIMDLFVAAIADIEPKMSNQNALSWGYFDQDKRCWEENQLKASNFPVHLLPKVGSVGEVAGVLKATWLDLPLGIPVYLAAGDMQAAAFATLGVDLTKALLNVGTSSQLAIVVPKEERGRPLTKALVRYPYVDGTELLVAPSLNGGNALNKLVDCGLLFLKRFGLEPSRNEVWRALLEEAAELDSTSLRARPTLMGERHDPASTGSIFDLDATNLTMGDLMLSFCRGLITNLSDMLPVSYLDQRNVKEIVMAGGAITRNPVLRSEVANVFSCQTTLGDNARDSAFGAALFTF